MKQRIPSIILFGIPILIAALIKILIGSPLTIPFNADEAIVALMARHINQGHLPAFFYGQYYMGSLDAMLVALGFRVFGEDIWVIRLVQSILYLGTVATTIMLARRLLKPDRAALYAGLLAAIPTVNVALYSTVSLGGYGEMLLIGNLLLLGGIGLIKEIKRDQLRGKHFYWSLFLWSFGAGFAFWVMGLTLVYIIPVLIYFGLHLIRYQKPNLLQAILVLLAGGILGSAPWWGAAFQEGNWGVISELAGGAIAGVSSGSWFFRVGNRTINLAILGGSVMTGIRPPWSVQWLMLPLMPFVLVFWMAVLYYSFQKYIINKERPIGSLIALIGLVLATGFILSPYGDDPSGRYFLPFLIPISIFGADLITDQLGGQKRWEYALVGLLLLFNLGGIIQSMRANPPGITTQFDSVTQVDHSQMNLLIDFLLDNDIRAGYSNYWVSYPLAFLSQEEILFIPRLPYHEDFRYTSRDDRYPPYTESIKASNSIAYITTNHPALDDYLKSNFESLNITWLEERIGDYTVYYQLSSPVHVDEIGLGETTIP